MAKVYKVLRADEWRAAAQLTAFAGSPDDCRDGFIHLSTRAQLKETIARHFAAHDGLVLLEFDAHALGTELVWEPSRGGALFPHYYGALPLASAARRIEIAPGADGSGLLPEDG